MIWDKLSPFYDFFETVYNGKCYKGIAEKIKEYVTEDDIVLECLLKGYTLKGKVIRPAKVVVNKLD